MVNCINYQARLEEEKLKVGEAKKNITNHQNFIQQILNEYNGIVPNGYSHESIEEKIPTWEKGVEEMGLMMLKNATLPQSAFTSEDLEIKKRLQIAENNLKYWTNEKNKATGKRDATQQELNNMGSEDESIAYRCHSDYNQIKACNEQKQSKEQRNTQRKNHRKGIETENKIIADADAEIEKLNEVIQTINKKNTKLKELSGLHKQSKTLDLELEGAEMWAQITETMLLNRQELIKGIGAPKKYTKEEIMAMFSPDKGDEQENAQEEIVASYESTASVTENYDALYSM